MCGAQAEDQSSWPTCGSCGGVQLPGQEFCLAHVDEAARVAFLASLQPGSDLDLRGTPISPDLLAAVFEALKEEQTPKVQFARFDGVQFIGDAWFSGAQFSGNATFIERSFPRPSGRPPDCG